jgi:hypothetical protein
MDSDPLRGHRHVSEAVIDYSERIAESEIVSPLTLVHSMMTVPLNAFGFVGRRTRMRVL